MHTFSPTGFIKGAWEIFKLRPWFFIGMAALFLLLSYLPGILLETFFPSPVETSGPSETYAYFLATWPYQILVWVASLFLTVAVLEFALRALDNVHGITFTAIRDPKVIVSYVAAQVLVGLATVLGFILFIIPGIILSIAFSLTSYYIVDQKMGPIEAMKASFAATRGFKWRIVFLSGLLGLLNLGGFLILGVGLLVTMPVTVIAMAAMYRALSSGSIHTSPLSTNEKITAALISFLPIVLIGSIIVFAVSMPSSESSAAPFTDVEASVSESLPQ